jgi:pilus assembly protein CpaB
MNSRTRLTLSAAAAASGIFLSHVYLARYEREMAGGAPQQVLMVTRDLALGELVTRSVLDTKELPEAFVEARHIMAEDLERVVGTRVTSSVESGSSLLWTDLDTMQDGRTLSGLVRVGMRAYTLPERDVTFDGLLRPGDRVDVLFTPTDKKLEATTLLTSALVLTVGRDLGEGDKKEKDLRAGRVTLSVTPAQAELLAQREGTGRFRLSLRNPQDAVALDDKPEERDPAGASVSRGRSGGEHALR